MVYIPSNFTKKNINISMLFRHLMIIKKSTMLVMNLIIINKYIEALMLRHSKTTQSLMTSLSKLKDSKKEITDKLKASIARNNQLYQQHSTSTRRFSQRVIANRQRSIEVFEKKLTHKMRSDELNELKLSLVQQEAVRKRQEIQRKIEEIGNRNQQRIKELHLIEEQLIKKIQQDIEKNDTKEKHLRAEYNRIQKQEKQVNETKAYQKKESYEQWRLLQAQKWRIQGLARQHELRQNVLIQQKNPIPTKKQQKKRNDDRYIPTEKQYNKLKPPTVVNSKQMGNQYLEQAKLMHRQHVIKKNKKKLMNVNLKVINYGSDMMEKIYRNTSDLSNFKIVKEQKQPLPLEKIQPTQIKEEQPIIPITQQPKFEFKMSEDLQTERYLKLIKTNLQELAKSNNPQTNFEQQIVNHKS